MTAPAHQSDPWQNRAPDPTACGPDFGRLVEAVRRLQDSVVQIAAPDDAVRCAAERIEEVATSLLAWQVDEQTRCAGRRPDLPGRGHPLLQPVAVDDQTATTLRGRVTFTQY